VLSAATVILIHDSSENASHPTGTTVRIKDFLKNVPVRRQAALKTTSKTIAKIKKTLQAYTIARPATRFSLKVLRSPLDNGNWTYSPSPNAGMAEAALTVFGRDVAGQCIERSWSSADNFSMIDGNLPSPSASQRDSVIYKFSALLPTPESSELRPKSSWTPSC
jgi:DNA mismatch repair ATPase MutL